MIYNTKGNRLRRISFNGRDIRRIDCLSADEWHRVWYKYDGQIVFGAKNGREYAYDLDDLSSGKTLQYQEKTSLSTNPPFSLNSEISSLSGVCYIDDRSGSLLEIGESSLQGSRGAIRSLSFSEVSAIRQSGIKDNRNLVSVDFPKLKTIGNYGFQNCYSLLSAEFPSLTSTSYASMLECSSMVSVDIPNIQNIGYKCFNRCFNLTSVNMPDVKTVQQAAFSDDKVLSVLSVAEDNMNIRFYTNTDDFTVSSMGIVMKNTSNVILWGSIPFCSGDITLPSDITAIGDEAFFFCKRITNMSMPEVVRIGDGGFKNCNGINHLDAPKTKYIGGTAFDNCRCLSSCHFPDLTAIGHGAFISNEKLMMLSVAEDNPYIRFLTDDNQLSNAGTVMIQGYQKQNRECSWSSVSALGSVVLPDYVTQINNWTFHARKGVTDITINNAQWIGSNCFTNCNALTAIYMMNITNVPTLSESSTFSRSGKHPPIDIFVPPNMVDLFSNATNWKVAIASGSVRILPGG